MDKEQLATMASTLRDLHHESVPLVLPNVWDAAGARLVEAAGFPVVATSSGAVAAALGYEDNDSMPRNEAFDAVARISKSVAVPVTADIEAGYQLSPDDIVAQLLRAGAVGCNLEDKDHHGPGKLISGAEQSERLAGVRQAANAAGVDVVINARVDVAFSSSSIDGDDFKEAVERARAYLAAGADCVYPIRLLDERLIGEFAQLVQAPINIMLGRGRPPLGRLAELDVSRVSLAGGLMRRAYSTVRDSVAELRESIPRRDR
jgi:2-methylisocitrate lyase-like PEP mutase family enzyme